MRSKEFPKYQKEAAALTMSRNEGIPIIPRSEEYVLKKHMELKFKVPRTN